MVLIPVYSSEVDSYTRIVLLTYGAVEDINKELNTLLDSAIDLANEEGKFKDRELYKIIYKIIGGKLVSRLEKRIEKINETHFLRVDLDESIYRDLNTLSTPSFPIYGKLSVAFKAGRYIIGTDKLGHFISQGYTYFKMFYLKKQDIEKILDYGTRTEIKYFGLTTTGIFSFADLTANFQGMRFWNDLLMRNDDILGDQGRGPYIQLQNIRWAKVKDIDMRHYFDGAWDERINWNLYRNCEIKAMVFNRIPGEQKKMYLLKSDARDTEIRELIKKYDIFSRYLINIHDEQAYEVVFKR
jgi:hypothetical protein